MGGDQGEGDILTGTMIRDVLVVNPEAPKYIKIMNTMGQRQVDLIIAFSSLILISNAFDQSDHEFKG